MKTQAAPPHRIPPMRACSRRSLVVLPREIRALRAAMVARVAGEVKQR